MNKCADLCLNHVLQKCTLLCKYNMEGTHKIIFTILKVNFLCTVLIWIQPHKCSKAINIHYYSEEKSVINLSKN